MKDITDIFIDVLQQAGSVDMAEAEFKKKPTANGVMKLVIMSATVLWISAKSISVTVKRCGII